MSFRSLHHVPVSSPGAESNFKKSVAGGVALDRLLELEKPPQEIINYFEKIDSSKVPLWGMDSLSRASLPEKDDFIIFHHSDGTVHVAEVLGSYESKKSSNSIWGKSGKWNILIFLNDLRKWDTPSELVYGLSGYSDRFILRGQMKNSALVVSRS